MSGLGARARSWPERLRWSLQQGWVALTVPDMLALALLLLAAGLQWQLIEPLRAQLAGLQGTVLQDRQAIAVHSAIVARATGHLDARGDFLALLPAATARDARLKTLHVLLAATGLQMLRLDYKREDEQALPVDRLRLHLSVQGRYMLLRQFVHQLLEQVPSLAVDQIFFAKDGKTPDSMTLTLEASLYLQREVGEGSP